MSAAHTLSPMALRTPPAASRTGPSFALALTMHVLLFLGMSLAVRWNTKPQTPAVAQVWSALPPIMEVTPPPQPTPTPQPQPQPAPPLEKPDIALEKQKKEQAQRRQKEEEKRKKEQEAKRKAEAEAQAKAQAQQKAEQAQREALRKEEAERLLKQLSAAAPAAAPSDGAGQDTGWHAQVIGCIRPHIAYSVPENTSAQVYAEFELDLLPTGEQVAVRLTRASQLPGFDAAAERAIRRCNPIPRRTDGTVLRRFVLVVRPVEMR